MVLPEAVVDAKMRAVRACSTYCVGEVPFFSLSTLATHPAVSPLCYPLENADPVSASVCDPGNGIETQCLVKDPG